MLLSVWVTLNNRLFLLPCNPGLEVRHKETYFAGLLHGGRHFVQQCFYFSCTNVHIVPSGLEMWLWNKITNRSYVCSSMFPSMNAHDENNHRVVKTTSSDGPQWRAVSCSEPRAHVSAALETLQKVGAAFLTESCVWEEKNFTRSSAGRGVRICLCSAAWVCPGSGTVTRRMSGTRGVTAPPRSSALSETIQTRNVCSVAVETGSQSASLFSYRADRRKQRLTEKAGGWKSARKEERRRVLVTHGCLSPLRDLRPSLYLEISLSGPMSLIKGDEWKTGAGPAFLPRVFCCVWPSSSFPWRSHEKQTGSVETDPSRNRTGSVETRFRFCSSNLWCPRFLSFIILTCQTRNSCVSPVTLGP